MGVCGLPKMLLARLRLCNNLESNYFLTISSGVRKFFAFSLISISLPGQLLVYELLLGWLFFLKDVENFRKRLYFGKCQMDEMKCI